MLIGAALILCLLSVPLAGGRLSALADIRFRDAWLLPSALGVQLLIVYAIPDWPGWILDSLHVWTYAFAALFVFRNWRVPGVLVIALGGLSNFIAIAANSGVMPASKSALATAGLADTPGQFASSAGLDHPHLLWLGDIFAVPASWPVSNVYSIGDMLIVVGAFVLVHAASGSRLGELLRRPGAEAVSR